MSLRQSIGGHFFFFSHLLFEGGHFHTEVKDEAIECLEQGRFEENLTEQGMTGEDGVISGMSCSAKTLSVNLVVARGRCGLLGLGIPSSLLLLLLV